MSQLDLPIIKEYKISDQDYHEFYEYLAVWHCLTIGISADLLFLTKSWDNTPLLPSLIPYLIEKYKKNYLLSSEFWQEVIVKVVQTYGQFYDSLESDSSRCLPEIRIKFALYLANLPNEFKYLALHQGNLALCSWLTANDAPLDKVFDVDDDKDCRLLKRILYQEDKPFLESLKLLLEKVKDAQNIDINQLQRIKSVLEGWKLLNRFGEIPSLPQIEVEAKLKKTQVEVEAKPINYTEILPCDIKLEMIAIPAGEFMMGGDGNDEKPIHQVTLKGFYLGKYPITQAQYQAIMGNNPSHFKGDNRPVEQVSWEMAQEFCQKLSEKTGKPFMLPTEAQWEYSCRGGTTTEYYFGDDDTQLGEYAWYHENSNNRTHPVGGKKPNNWGLYDIHGNVWEWCEDNWESNYHNHPSDGSAFKNNSDLFVLRGGSWFNHSIYYRCAYRHRNCRLYINRNFGFRVALAL